MPRPDSLLSVVIERDGDRANVEISLVEGTTPVTRFGTLLPTSTPMLLPDLSGVPISSLLFTHQESPWRAQITSTAKPLAPIGYSLYVGFQSSSAPEQLFPRMRTHIESFGAKHDGGADAVHEWTIDNTGRGARVGLTWTQVGNEWLYEMAILSFADKDSPVIIPPANAVQKKTP